MLKKKSVTRALAALWALAGSLIMFLTSVVTLRAGYMTITADLLLKIIITYVHSRSTAAGGNNTHASKEELCCLGEEYTAEEKTDVSPGGYTIASIVGWREDETLYRKCLQAFARDPDCGRVIAGIDGDTPDDEQMARIFLEVFPAGLVIRLPQRLSEVLDTWLDRNPTENTTESITSMEHLESWIRDILREALLPSSISGVRHICVMQPHHSKKDILMTALTVASVIGQEVGAEYVFSTDSDSEITDGALGHVTHGLSRDANVGGVAGHLRFFHPKPTFLSKMTTSHYWFEQQIAKSQGAIFGATECQPGPCAGFRVSALRSVLVPWYTQEFCGHRTVTNEDRHLTTRLLWAGYQVQYVPKGIVYTETPHDFVGWVKQQARWSRGTMIETTWYPWLFSQISFWHLYNIIKARTIPIITFWSVTRYAMGFGDPWILRHGMATDIICSMALQAFYVGVFGDDVTTPLDIIWMVPSIIWFFAMSPGIVVWSLLTILDDSWGNLPRAIQWAGQQTKPQKTGVTRPGAAWKTVGFQILWILLIVLAALRLVRESLRV